MKPNGGFDNDNTSWLYRITNKINGKKYYGQSQRPFSRWVVMVDANGEFYLLDDRNNYGWNFGHDMYEFGGKNFKFEVLESGDRLSIRKREAELIKAESMWPMGYNHEYSFTGIGRLTKSKLQQAELEASK